MMYFMLGIWVISLTSILCVLFRPWKIPEWVWVVSGSILLLLLQLITFKTATFAIQEGIDVYLFLTGMMLLSEQARNEGLFDGLADWAKRHAQGSSQRLFVLIYAAGVLVTAFLSNDATAVVMTPAVYTCVKRVGGKPLPYLFACAFVANAASFILPISNPANLVVFASHLPGIFSWIKLFGLASIISTLITFFILWFWFRKVLLTPLVNHKEENEGELTLGGKLTAAGLLAIVFVLMVASQLEWKLGLPTFLSASFVSGVIAIQQKKSPFQILKGVAWGVIPLVAGLFVIVEAMNQAGALKLTHFLLIQAGQFPSILGKLASAFGVGIASNLINNLPIGLLSGLAIHRDGISEGVRNAVLLGVDLGPNLSVTGSLATILWLIALRREGEEVSGWKFFQVGLLAMPLALGLAVLMLR